MLLALSVISALHLFKCSFVVQLDGLVDVEHVRVHRTHLVILLLLQIQLLMNCFGPHDVLIHIPTEILVELIVRVFGQWKHGIEQDLMLSHVDA